MAHLGSFSAHVDAAPDATFARITDVSGLADWNRGIVEIVEMPERLEPGAVWKVKIRALGSTWVSRSQVSQIDPVKGRFVHRSQSDDGNPSYATWTWEVTPEGEGSNVTVSYELFPKSFWRKHLLIKIRKPALRKEVERSLAALADSFGGGTGPRSSD